MMRIDDMTTTSLVELHALVAECLAIDDSCLLCSKEFGVREHRDWRLQADAFEAELTRRQVDWQAALELTSHLRVFDPLDPVKYDFALFGLGIEEKL